MNTEETKKLLALIAVYYPNFNPENKALTVKAWSATLADIRFEDMQKALLAFVRTSDSPFAPNIGQLLARLDNIQNGDIDDGEAWNLVYNAICNSAYNAEREFAKLPEVIRETLHTPSQLREWATSDINGNALQVIHSNFLRAYTQVKARQKDNRRLTPDLRKQIESKAYKWLPEPEQKEPEVMTNESEIKGYIERLRKAVNG
jgi:hypothetical protein